MNRGPHSRRDALKLIGFGAGAAVTVTPWARATSVAPDYRPSADYFPLSQVRLGAGPFLAAQQLDAKYLLELEPDRMLHGFRVNAGLAPRAPIYGGWESVEPWIEIRCHGHTLGHYLSAAACMYASTDDPRFADRVDYIISELEQCQVKTGGWLAAFPDGVAPLTDSLAGKPFAGVPWYTTHKVLAGLRDAHVYRGSEAALEALKRFADWIDRASSDVRKDRMQAMLDREHGGMNEVLADLFALTRDPRHLELATRFTHQKILWMLSGKRDALDGLHANTQIPKVIGISRLGALGNDRSSVLAAQFFWETVVNQRSFATGGHGDNEHFFPKNEFTKHLGSAKTMETCCTHNMLRLTRSLYASDPQATYFDYFERALFNGILAAQDPESGMNTYFQATRPGYVRLYHTPFDSFWCCTGSGIENHARYGESIFASRGLDTLYVNLFMNATLDWKDAGLKLEQRSAFPDGDVTRLKVNAGNSRRLTLQIRHPSWCPVMSISHGRRRWKSRRPGSYFSLPDVLVADGDVIEIRTPMSLRLVPLPGAPEQAAVAYGPIVLAARLGTAGLTPGSQLIVNERESGKMLNESIDIPRWSRPLAELPKAVERVDKESLRFRAKGFAGGAEVELIPFFRLAHERYNLYWRQS